MNKIVLSDSDKHELNVAIFFLTVMCLLFALLCSGILIELDLLDLRMESARVFLIIASLTMLIVLAAIGIRYRISGLYLGLAASVGISFSILFAEARLGATAAAAPQARKLRLETLCKGLLCIHVILITGCPCD